MSDGTHLTTWVTRETKERFAAVARHQGCPIQHFFKRLAELMLRGASAGEVGREAHAIVGAPVTPVSVAGVARRTTRRTVAATQSASMASSAAVQQQQAATAQQQSATAQQQSATAQQQSATAQQQAAARPAGVPAVGTVVPALPAGCKPETKNGVQYQNCGGVRYRAAFQGENLVYVVQ